MNQKFKIKKTNGKYKSFPHFKYAIVLSYNNRPFSYLTRTEYRQFWFTLREWCWETWGPSKELDDWLDSLSLAGANPIAPMSHNLHWCWQNDKYATRIYLADEKDLNWFTLRWSNE